MKSRRVFFEGEKHEGWEVRLITESRKERKKVTMGTNSAPRKSKLPIYAHARVGSERGGGGEKGGKHTSTSRRAGEKTWGNLSSSPS